MGKRKKKSIQEKTWGRHWEGAWPKQKPRTPVTRAPAPARMAPFRRHTTLFSLQDPSACVLPTLGLPHLLTQLYYYYCSCWGCYQRLRGFKAGTTVTFLWTEAHITWPVPSQCQSSLSNNSASPPASAWSPSVHEFCMDKELTVRLLSRSLTSQNASSCWILQLFVMVMGKTSVSPSLPLRSSALIYKMVVIIISTSWAYYGD